MRADPLPGLCVPRNEHDWQAIPPTIDRSRPRSSDSFRRFSRATTVSRQVSGVIPRYGDFATLQAELAPMHE